MSNGQNGNGNGNGGGFHILQRSRLIVEKNSEVLVEAAEAGKLDDVTKLIGDQGVDPNCHDAKRFRTPLMAACSFSRVDVARKLYESGARLREEDANRWDALCWACWGAGAGGGWTDDTLPTFNFLFDRIKQEKWERVYTTSTGHTALMLYVKYVSAAKLAASGGASDASGAASLRAQIAKAQLEQFEVLNRLINVIPDLAYDTFFKKNSFGQTVMDMTRRSLWLDKLFKIGDDLRLKYPDKVKASELKSKQPKAAAKVHRDEEKEDDPDHLPTKEAPGVFAACFGGSSTSAVGGRK